MGIFLKFIFFKFVIFGYNISLLNLNSAYRKVTFRKFEAEFVFKDELLTLLLSKFALYKFEVFDTKEITPSL